MAIQKRVLIIGGNGFVGAHLAAGAGQRGFRVSVLGTSARPVLGDLDYYQGDITDLDQIYALGDKVKPDFIMNSAAISDIDYAQKEKEIAFGVNVMGAKNGALLAKSLGCPYVWFSSDAVYEGSEDRYSETSMTVPVNYYGMTKLLGEQEIQTVYPSSLILRISWILGFPLGGKEASLAIIGKRMRKKEPIYASYLENRSPIDVKTLCDGTFELLDLEKSGIYNLGSTDYASRPAIMELIGEVYDYNKDLMTVIGEGAKRHKNGVLIVDKALDVLQKTKLKTVKETVQIALAGL